MAEQNAEARIRQLTGELHKANMEINRLVMENADKDYTIFCLKRYITDQEEKKKQEEQAETGWNVSDWQIALLEQVTGKTDEELREYIAKIFGKKPTEKTKDEIAFSSVTLYDFSSLVPSAEGECPCKGCDMRGADCHVKCPRYKAWREWMDCFRDERNKESSEEAYFKKPRKHRSTGY